MILRHKFDIDIVGTRTLLCTYIIIQRNMNTKTTMSMTEARKQFFDIGDQVQNPGVYFTLTEKGRPKVVIMSAEEFESWKDTIEVKEEFPDILTDIRETEEAFKSGEYKGWTNLEQLLVSEGFLIADKPKNQYGISSQIKAKGRKRTKKIAQG